MDKIRVLFMPTAEAGNTNAQSLNVREIALRLDPQRIESTLWYEREPDPRLLKREGIRLLQLPVRRKTLRILREMLTGYDIISYIDCSPASYLFLHAPIWMRRGAIAVYHAEAPATQSVNPSRTLRFLYNGTFPRADVYTAITEYVARDVGRDGTRKASYILPVGVDTRAFTPPERRDNASPVVLFAGTLIERKGPQCVLDAAMQFPQASFRLVGAGREGFDAVLRRIADDRRLKNVIFEGPRTQTELIDILRQSDIFLLPSRLEGIPKVTLEASATGLPCVVYRDYETPSVVDGVTGFQVGSFEEMMQALGKLIADRSLRERMGNAARNHMQNFDWDVVSRYWQSAFLEIAAGRKK